LKYTVVAKKIKVFTSDAENKTKFLQALTLININVLTKVAINVVK